MNSAKHNDHTNLGGMTDNNTFDLANFNNKSGNDILLFPSSASLTKYSQSKSKVFKKDAIHLILFCLKTGITGNENIIQFLKQNEIVLKGRTFD